MVKHELLTKLAMTPDDAQILISGTSFNYYELLGVKEGCFSNQEGKPVVEIEIRDTEVE